jgi:16S rRNA (uracil1498-N3)-methyltransferase
MKHLPRFTIPEDAAGFKSDGILRVTGGELHHMRDVMRLRPGTEVMLCSPSGLEYAGRIAGFEPNAAMITVAAAPHQQVHVSPRLILAAGVIRAVRMDLLIEKASELGAAEFWPLRCARSVVREPSSERRERWRRISLAAAKQSLRSRSMEIHELADVGAMARRLPKTAFAAICMAGATPLSAMIRGMGDSLRTSPAVALAIGPEGDFTSEEQAVMREAGFIAAGLGNSRLRSETAALAALSIVAGTLAELEQPASSARAVQVEMQGKVR